MAAKVKIQVIADEAYPYWFFQQSGRGYEIEIDQEIVDRWNALDKERMELSEIIYPLWAEAKNAKRKKIVVHTDDEAIVIP